MNDETQHIQKEPPNTMSAVEPYVKHLEGLLSDFSWCAGSPDGDYQIEAALNGELSQTLRRLVPIEALHESGAFFTSEEMANLLIESEDANHSLNKKFLDPACGGGNLLLAQARHLPLSETLGETLESWGQILLGFDIHEVFVRATRARLALLAAQRGSFYNERVSSPEKLFPHIRVSNSYTTTWPDAAHVILNPPFNRIEVPKRCSWATGRVSQAALFITKCLEELEENATVSALLPDVLRSGSRYRAWREVVEKHTQIQGIQIVGRFDIKTNVDVFMLTFTIREQGNKDRIVPWVQPNYQGDTTLPTIGDRCEVKVGRVVPYRDKESGPERLYLDVRHAPAWKRVKDWNSRRYSGPTFKPPFVVVRRNSKSANTNRAVATLVTGREQVAVENHLIVVRPREGTVRACKEVMNVLRDPRTDQWLNEYIRCRHLTVASLASIPWWET